MPRSHRIAPRRKLPPRDRSKRHLLRLRRKTRGKGPPRQEPASRGNPKRLLHNHRVAVRLHKDHRLMDNHRRRIQKPPHPHPILKTPPRPRQRRGRILNAGRRHKPPPQTKRLERTANRRRLVGPRDLKRINAPVHRPDRPKVPAANATRQWQRPNKPRRKPNHPAKARVARPPATKRP